MAIVAGVSNSFKEEVLTGEHDINNDTFKIALYEETANISPDTDEYTSSGESSGEGYDAGGQELTGAVVGLDDGVAIVTFNDVTWLSATISAAGAIIYNESKGNKAVAVLDFNGTKASTNGDFSVIFPAFDKNNAVIQLA